MKKFIFNEDQRCINPNRIEVGNKEFWIEIQTAENEGKWYHGHQYWSRGHHFNWYVYLNTYHCDTEAQAICNEIDFLIKSLQRENDSLRSSFDVPDSIFKELKDLKEKNKTPQLSLF